MKNIKKSMYLLLGVFALCMFSQATFAQEKVQPKKEIKVLKKGDKIRSTNGQRQVVDRKTKPAQRPAVQRNNQNKPRTISGKPTIKRPTPANKQVRPVEKRPRPAVQNNTATTTKGRLKGIRQGKAITARPKAISSQNQQAMRSGHSKVKAMRIKLNAAKEKVAKEKAANPNSADVKAKEARLQQAEAKIKAMEQEITNQRKTISNISQ